MVAVDDLELHYIDVKTVFFNEDLEKNSFKGQAETSFLKMFSDHAFLFLKKFLRT